MARGGREVEDEATVVPPPFPRREARAAGTGAAGPEWWWGPVAGALTLAGALALVALVWLLARPLALTLTAIVIGEALGPAVGWFERRMSRPLAVAVVYLLLLLVVAGLAALAIPPLVAQARELIEAGPALLARGRGLLDRLEGVGGDRLAGLLSGGDESGGQLVLLPLRVFSSLTEIVLVVAMTAYWLVITPALRRFVLSLFPAGRRPGAGLVLREMSHVMGGYVRGVIIDAVVVGTVVYIGLLVIGVDYALVLALLAAVGELLPVIGPIVASLPAIAIALLDSPPRALVVLLFYLLVQQLEGNVLLPNVMRRQSDIPSLLVLFAFFAGISAGGILGALVAIPLAGALRVLVIQVVAPAVRGWSGATSRGAPAIAGTEAGDGRDETT